MPEHNGNVAVETRPAPVKSGEIKPARREVPDLFSQMQDEMNRLWGAWPFVGALRRRPLAEGRIVPRTDIYEQNGAIVIEAELPGLKKDEVDVTIDNGDLVIEAEHKTSSDVKEEDYFRAERSFGRVYRRFPLPDGIDTSKIQANLVEGVLKVSVPIPHKTEPKAIKVKIS